MALSDKDILITPSRGQTSEPKIEFKGASASLGPQTILLNVYPTNNGTISFEGSAGQLFSISNEMSGTLYLVNDISGIPSIEVLDTGLVKLAQYSGNVLIGTGTDNGAKLQVNGITTIAGDNYTQYGPNSSWGAYLRIGGNSTSASSNIASIATSNGNLHIDAATTSATYLNFYSGLAGVSFGGGGIGTVAWMGPDGDLWKGTADNTGVQYVQNTGTWSINITGSSGLVGGLTAPNIFNNMGLNHPAITDFNSVPGFGSYYISHGANSPTGGSTQWYGFTLGLGADYTTTYGSQLYWPRAALSGTTRNYLYLRDREASTWNSWRKVDAGVSDSLADGSTNLGAHRFRKNQTLNDYTTAALWTESYDNTPTGIAFHISGVVGKFLQMDTSGNLKWNDARILDAANFLNYSPTLTGGGASGTWGISITGSASRLTNLTSTTNSSAGSDNTESCISYIGGLSPVFGQTDGALYSHVYSGSWKHNIYGDYRTGQLAVRGKNNGTWQPWRTIIDSGNIGSFVQGTSLITTTATNKTIAVGEYCTVTAAGLTITLPASPVAGNTVKIGVLTFTNTTVARNGQNIMGLAENLTIDTPDATMTLTFIDSTRGWRIS